MYVYLYKVCEAQNKIFFFFHIYTMIYLYQIKRCHYRVDGWEDGCRIYRLIVIKHKGVFLLQNGENRSQFTGIINLNKNCYGLDYRPSNKSICKNIVGQFVCGYSYSYNRKTIFCNLIKTRLILPVRTRKLTSIFYNLAFLGNYDRPTDERTNRPQLVYNSKKSTLKQLFDFPSVSLKQCQEMYLCTNSSRSPSTWLYGPLYRHLMAHRTNLDNEMYMIAMSTVLRTVRASVQASGGTQDRPKRNKMYDPLYRHITGPTKKTSYRDKDTINFWMNIQESRYFKVLFIDSTSTFYKSISALLHDSMKLSSRPSSTFLPLRPSSPSSGPSSPSLSQSSPIFKSIFMSFRDAVVLYLVAVCVFAVLRVHALCLVLGLVRHRTLDEATTIFVI